MLNSSSLTSKYQRYIYSTCRTIAGRYAS